MNMRHRTEVRNSFRDDQSETEIRRQIVRMTIGGISTKDTGMNYFLKVHTLDVS
jgi:hypothetical protein